MQGTLPFCLYMGNRVPKSRKSKPTELRPVDLADPGQADKLQESGSSVLLADEQARAAHIESLLHGFARSIAKVIAAQILDEAGHPVEADKLRQTGEPI